MAGISRGEFLRYLSAALPWLTGVAWGISTVKKVEPQHGSTTRLVSPSNHTAGPAALLGGFYSLGGRLIDSSPMYGQAEAVTGRASVQLGINAQLFLATKVWTSGRERGVSQIKESLRLLGRQKLELMQVHNLVDWKTQIRTLRAYKEAGVFRYIGLTHYQTSAFDELARILKNEAVDFLQIPYSIAETAADACLLGIAHERGVAVIANEPFAQGRLFTG